MINREEKENVSILNSFDFTAIEEMDPSLGKIKKIMKAEGHRVVYDREVPFELRIQDTNTGIYQRSIYF